MVDKLFLPLETMLTTPASSVDEKNEVDEISLDSSNTDDEILIDKVNDGLFSKEIRELASISLMLCESRSIKGIIDYRYIRRQPYQDKQDISDDPLRICAKLVNAFHEITPKNDDFSITIWALIHLLRNTFIKFAGMKTKRNEVSLCINKDDLLDIIYVNYMALYLLSCKDYSIYQADGEYVFSSHASIKTEQDKITILNKFFKIAIY